VCDCVAGDQNLKKSKAKKRRIRWDTSSFEHFFAMNRVYTLVQNSLFLVACQRLLSGEPQNTITGLSAQNLNETGYTNSIRTKQSFHVIQWPPSDNLINFSRFRKSNAICGCLSRMNHLCDMTQQGPLALECIFYFSSGCIATAASLGPAA
jgi:hypothetical protein